VDAATPLDLANRWLFVTDLAQQSWCEQQVFYKFRPPRDTDDLLSVDIPNPSVEKGSIIHLAREAELHTKVPVPTTTKEDAFAVTVINIIGSLRRLLSGSPMVREMPIFGMPFDLGIFVSGIIDQVQCDPESMHYDIWELKTRSSMSVPSGAQKDSTKIQVMLYKKMLDDLILNRITHRMIEKHRKVDLYLELSLSVQAECPGSENNLHQLLSVLFDMGQKMTCVSQLFVEYCYQEDKSAIALEEVQYDEAWLCQKITHYSEFWYGKREVCGVDIEEAWKCHSCDFQDHCAWRAMKADEYTRKCTQQKQIKKNISVCLRGLFLLCRMLVGAATNISETTGYPPLVSIEY
ncbi:hypothetical protein CAPTEDRAFT_98409, partial [Capitella teleta]